MTTAAPEGHAGESLAVTSFRWDFVTDPPTRLLAELAVARTHLGRGRLDEAAKASRRLLRHVDQKLPPGAPGADLAPRLATIRADGRAVLALSLALRDHPDGAAAVAQSVAEYQHLLDAGRELRPPSHAGYGMVLVLAGRPRDSVDPLVRATEAGEDVVASLVRRAAAQLLAEGSVPDGARLLTAAHERYPRDPDLAVDLAAARERLDDPAAAADAHVAAGALCAQDGLFDRALAHFARATDLVPQHPLATLGRCQAMLAVGQVPAAVSEVQRVLRDQENLAGAWAVMALALGMMGMPEQARATVEHGLGIFRNDPWLLDTRVRFVRASGDGAAALEAVELALRVDPTDRDWRRTKAELLLERHQDGDDVEQALAALRELATSAPDDVAAGIRLATALRDLGQPADALDVVIRALADHPGHPGLVVAEVQCLADLDRLREATARAREALGSGVRAPELRVLLAECLLALDRTGAAAEAAQRAVDDEPSARALRVRGLARHRRHDWAGAADDLETALRLGVRDDAACSALADSLVELAQGSSDDGDLARQRLERALQLDPSHARGRRLLVDRLQAEGDLPAALQHADLGVDANPDDAALLAARGTVHRALEQLPQAEEDLRRALARQPDLVQAHAELGELLRARGRPREALEHFERAHRGRPEDPWILAGRAAAEYALDLYDEALASLGRALALHPDYPWAHGVKAVVHADVDELDQARAEVREALALDPTLGWCWMLSGWLALNEDVDPGADEEEARRAGRSAAERALSDLTTASRLDPDDPAPLSGAGEALLLLGDGARAAEMYDRAIEAARAVIAGNGGRDPDTWANLAWCLLRRRHHEDAVDAYLQVLSADSDNPVASVDLALTLLCAGRTEVGLEELGRSMARVRAIAHPGRRKAVLREASRDLTVLAAQQMAERPDDVRRARTVITNPGSDDGGVRPSGLQVSPA